MKKPIKDRMLKAKARLKEMTNEIIEKIADKDLKEGCEIKYKKQKKDRIVYIEEYDGCDESERMYYFGRDSCEYIMEDCETKGWKILGTPPGLTRVLWWMEKENFDWHLESCGVMGKGISATLKIRKTLLYEAEKGKQEVDIDLSKPLVKDQSLPTIQFLYDLILNK